MKEELEPTSGSEARSAELSRLIDAARLDLPSGPAWASLSAHVASAWGGGASTGGFEPQVSHGSTPGVEGAAAKVGAKAAAGAGTLKGAGAVVLCVALASGGGFVLSRSASPPAQGVQEPTSLGGGESAKPSSSEIVGLAGSVVAPSGEGTPPGPASAESSHDRALAPPAPLLRSQPLATESEISLLRRAREQLIDAPSQSLVLCRRHQRLYPQGQLAQEREVLMIEALERLARADEAQNKREQFGKAFPDSPLKSRVKGSGH